MSQPQESRATEKVDDDNAAQKAQTAGALTGAAAGAVGVGAVTGGLGAPIGAVAGGLLGHAVGGVTSAETTSEAGTVEVLAAPGDDAADVNTAEDSVPELPKVQEAKE